ncbi:MAG: nucleotidyltransferase family protein [Actinomycetota bacterium]|nr:nucleotidyltransferase family protein [Actinomycetota bacterium]
MPQGKYPAVGGATRAFYIEVLQGALRIMQAAPTDHLVIGGLATRSLFGMPLSTAEDIDVFIRPEDAEGLLDRFSREGYSTYRRDEDWIYKAAKPDVTVDLIFRAGESIELDAEHLARSTVSKLDGLPLRIPSREDLVVMKALFDADDRQGRWYDAVSILRRFQVDWDYLADRGMEFAPRRVLSLLMYATDLGIDVPARAMDRLMPAATTPDRRLDGAAGRYE